jgi:hypothetical protein
MNESEAPNVTAPRRSPGSSSGLGGSQADGPGASLGRDARPIRSPRPVSCYGTVTGPAEVFHLNDVPDVPPISPATQTWLVVPGWGAAAK